MSKILCWNIDTLYCWKKQVEVNEDEVRNVDLGDSRSFTSMMTNKDDDVIDDVHTTCKDHDEEIYI